MILLSLPLSLSKPSNFIFTIFDSCSWLYYCKYVQSRDKKEFRSREGDENETRTMGEEVASDSGRGICIVLSFHKPGGSSSSRQEVL